MTAPATCLHDVLVAPRSTLSEARLLRRAPAYLPLTAKRALLEPVSDLPLSHAAIENATPHASLVRFNAALHPEDPPRERLRRQNAVDWNQNAVTFVMPRMAPPAGQRVVAILQVAMFDAVNWIDRRYQPYLVQLPASAATWKEAAETAAAGD